MQLENTGHPGINALFAKAHSADWDFERDVDWTIPVEKDEPLVGHEWTAFGKTETFRALPDEVKSYLNRRGIGRMLNILRVGESVAQDVCAKIALSVRQEDYRNHAVAQAMDEARHHLAYRRFLEKMDEEVEDIDVATEMMFDNVLSFDDPLRLVAAEQFYLEGLAMDIFEGIIRDATNPLLQRILTLITRDESRHMGFGVLYIEQWMRDHSIAAQISFARVWLRQILFTVTDRPGPIMLQRVVDRLRQVGVDNADELGARMLREQAELNAADLGEIAAGRRIPHLLKNTRRVGLLKPEILEEFGLTDHPIVAGALRASAAT
jgi:hypothetical protein